VARGAAGVTIFDPFVSFCRGMGALGSKSIAVVDTQMQMGIDTLITWCGGRPSDLVYEHALHALCRLVMHAAVARAVVESGVMKASV
jgi:hypothetical protein